MMRQDIQEFSNKVKGLASDVGDLKYGADALRDELCGGIDALLAILDEYWDFPRSRGFEDPGYLLDGLFQDLGRADVNLGDDDHYRNVQRQCDTQVFFAHANETVIGCHHE